MIGWFESLGIGSYYLRAYVIWGGGLAATALLGWWCRRWLPRGVRTVLVVGLVMALVRVVGFGNPMALRFFQRQVTPESIGARQWGVMEIDIRAYTRRIRQPELPNLAVGSSQVGAIFSHWVGDPTDPLEVFSLAGMKTLDYELYRDEIAARNPARVILFLSAFDLTAGPELYSWPLAPSHPLRMWDVVTRVRQAGVPEDVVSGPSHAYIASQLFPEYRYRFLFTGLLQQWTRKASTAVARVGVSTALHAAEVATAGAPAITPTTAPSAIDPARIREFLGYYLPQWLDYNVRFLRSFVEYCRCTAAREVDSALMVIRLRA